MNALFRIPLGKGRCIAVFASLPCLIIECYDGDELIDARKVL